jgi:hypothetical protein
MNRRIVAACFAALLVLSAASSAAAAPPVPPVFHVDDDNSCTDPIRQANTIYGGWAGYANQAYMILWLKTNPSVDPALNYTVDVVHQGTTDVTGQPVQFSTICPSPNENWRWGELVYGGFISGDQYTLVLHDSTGATLGSDSVRFINGPGI